jgi:hypothetical protein
LKQKLKERVMNRQRRIFTATLALISLIGEISSFSLRLLHRITRFGYALDSLAAGVGADLQVVGYGEAAWGVDTPPHVCRSRCQRERMRHETTPRSSIM